MGSGGSGHGTSGDSDATALDDGGPIVAQNDASAEGDGEEDDEEEDDEHAAIIGATSTTSATNGSRIDDREARRMSH